MSLVPEELYYSATHQWLKLREDGTALVGITDYAQEQLGDVVFIELPKAGSNVAAGDQVSVVESVKTASEIFAPVSGKILEVNGELLDAPELLNTEPYGNGWVFVLSPSDEAELESLHSSESYQRLSED